MDRAAPVPAAHIPPLKPVLSTRRHVVGWMETGNAVNTQDLLDGHEALWQQATRHPFLDGVHDGSLPAAALDRWLAQDERFVDALLRFQAAVLIRAPRADQLLLAQGLVALAEELRWFEGIARERGLALDAPLNAACREYIAVTGRRLTYEYALIAGENDSLALIHSGLQPVEPSHHIHPKVAGVSWRLRGIDGQMTRAKARERKGVSRIHCQQLRGPAIGAICHQDISGLDGEVRKAFALMLVRDLNPGQLTRQQIVGTMQGPDVSFRSHLAEMGGIDQQNTLAGRQPSRRQPHSQQRTAQPQQPPIAVLEAFVPGRSGDDAAAHAHQPTPSTQLFEGGQAQDVAEQGPQQHLGAGDSTDALESSQGVSLGFQIGWESLLHQSVPALLGARLGLRWLGICFMLISVRHSFGPFVQAGLFNA